MASVPPELQQLLSESVNRTQYQNPLFQAVTQMAYRGLPTYAREGTSLGQLGPAAPIQQQQDGGGIPDWLKMLMAGGAGAALGGLGGGNALGALVDGLKKLFGHGQSQGVQGDKPYGGGALTGGLPPQWTTGFEGWDPGVSDPSGRPLRPSVETSWNWGFDPNTDPNWYNPGFSGPSDPSGGSGVGPGMQNYYGSGGGDSMPTGSYWWEE